jgi:MATE family multidrug resistance protein
MSSSFVRAGWWTEARALLALSGPLMLTNLGQIAIQTTDVVMIGWLGPVPLASSALGGVLIFALMLFGIGVVAATAPMIAQDLGRRRHAVREPRRTVRQGLWAVVAIGVPAWLVLWNVAPVLTLLGQDPELITGARTYVHAAMWSYVPGLGFVVLRNFIAALERPRAGMVIMLIGIGVNAALDYGLIFGALGLPALGLLGAGIATSIANGLLFTALLGFLVIDRRFRRYALLGRLWRPDWARFAEIFRIGLPIGITLTLEIGLFAAAAFLMGLIGTVELAAHQIALQCAGVTFMVPLGLAQAATVRVGLAVGRGDPPGVLRAGLIALGTGTLFMSAMGAIMWTFPETIVGLFLDLSEPGSLAVLEFGATYLMVAAVFQVFDGGQVIAGGALRGLKDTRWPMVLAGIGYWMVGIASSVGLAFGVGLGGLGVWIGIVAGLAVSAVLLVVRFIIMQRRLDEAQGAHPPRPGRHPAPATGEVAG